MIFRRLCDVTQYHLVDLLTASEKTDQDCMRLKGCCWNLPNNKSTYCFQANDVLLWESYVNASPNSNRTPCGWLYHGQLRIMATELPSIKTIIPLMCPSYQTNTQQQQ